MRILDQLAAGRGERTQTANVAAAARCIAEPILLEEIAAGLGGADRTAADCAEVLTKVAESRPELVAPLAPSLLACLHHRNGRVRWEAAHAVALVAGLVPALVRAHVPLLAELLRTHAGVIVRDYVIDALLAWAATDDDACATALPLLAEALSLWEGRHVPRILGGLAAVAAARPHHAERIAALAVPFVDDGRASTRRAARALAGRHGRQAAKAQKPAKKAAARRTRA